MSPNGTPFAASAARCSGSAGQGFGADVADAAVGAGIAPGPAPCVVEHPKFVADAELSDQLGRIVGGAAEGGGGGQAARHRFGIMGSDDPAGESDVGEVLAEGVKIRVG
jgi:hypothetical protein